MHKYGIVSGRFLNLPKESRNADVNKLLLGIYQCDFAKKNGGVARMLAGIGPDGTQYDEVCLRTELEQLKEGIPVDIPDDINGGTMSIILEVHLLGWLADLLGAGGLGPYPESFSATHPCRDCWWHTSCWCAHVAFGSLDVHRKEPHAPGCRMTGEVLACEPCVERDEGEMLSLMSSLRAGSYSTKAQLADAMRCRGVNKLRSAIEYLPGSKVTEDVLADIMHLFFTGPTPQEAYHILEHLTKVVDGLTWDKYATARKAFNERLPKAHQLPGIVRPVTDGKAKTSLAMVWTADEAMRFAANGCVLPGDTLRHRVSSCAR